MNQFGKFLILGALSTLVDYLIFSLLVVLDLEYVLAIVFGYTSGLLVNYFLGRRYIFTSGTKVKKAHNEIIAVTVIAIFGLLINIAVVKLFSFYLWDMDLLYSRIIAIGVAFFWNFAARKIFVYH
jgi:putative flippase GtrA